MDWFSQCSDKNTSIFLLNIFFGVLCAILDVRLVHDKSSITVTPRHLLLSMIDHLLWIYLSGRGGGRGREPPG